MNKPTIHLRIQKTDEHGVCREVLHVWSEIEEVQPLDHQVKFILAKAAEAASAKRAAAFPI